MDFSTLHAAVGTVCFAASGLPFAVLASERAFGTRALSKDVKENLEYAGPFLLVAGSLSLLAHVVIEDASVFLITNYVVTALLWSVVLLAQHTPAKVAPKAAVKRAAPTKKKKGK